MTIMRLKAIDLTAMFDAEDQYFFPRLIDGKKHAIITGPNSASFNALKLFDLLEEMRILQLDQLFNDPFSVRRRKPA
ncbi:hypothetical protein A2625_02720 [candidate division WOR-1 bacterium RIFCSPHIGHO2_01_FULL_53_15]|uniref:Uncharacterized protein n=1 Tax=candidate division WOR-1 bacterium RIFCSPHIGHO2_01_FULL_53_15 TaxID=1802564 RepID=A0A1F4Q2F1_UNCSA|nr:MAG: hypothetical protein A2625_02720 [candidate division WOR-1 bacterium RIFCSPHIGHO2_01_FULL_53_15]